MTTFILWNVDQDLFSLGAFTLRWDVLIIVVAYVAVQRILSIRAPGATSNSDSALLTFYLLVFPLLLARLVYVLTEDAALLWRAPGRVLFPFDLEPSFAVDSSFGLSLYGAAAGVLIACWLFSRRSAAPSFFAVADRVSVASVLVAMLLFAASFLNSDIAGKPTASGFSVAHMHPVTEGLMQIPCCIMRNPDGPNPLDRVVVKKDHTTPAQDSVHQSVILYLFFKAGATEQQVNEFLIGDVKTFLFDMSDYVFEPGSEPLHFRIIVARDGQYIGRIQTLALTRFPVRLLEALLCLCLFVWAFPLWRRGHQPTGMLFAYVMLLFWGIHLAAALVKTDQTLKTLVIQVALFFFSAVFVIIRYKSTRRSSRPQKPASISDHQV